MAELNHQKKYLCDICQKMFTTGWYMKVHRKKHKQEICNSVETISDNKELLAISMHNESLDTINKEKLEDSVELANKNLVKEKKKKIKEKEKNPKIVTQDKNVND